MKFDSTFFKQFICQLEILKRLYHEGHIHFTNHLFACIYLVQSHSHTTLFLTYARDNVLARFYLR
jgi:hypothetical protein